MTKRGIVLISCLVPAALWLPTHASSQTLSAPNPAKQVLIGVRFKSDEIPCSEKAAMFHSSLAKQKLCPEWGFVDQNGKVLGSGFQVALSSSGEVVWGFVDREQVNENGRCIKDLTETGFEYMPCRKLEPDVYGWALLDSQAHIRRPAYELGKKGQMPAISDVGLFSEGLAAADFGSLGSDEWGYIDLEGNTVIRGHYDEAGPFCEGLAPVRFQPSKNEVNGVMHITLGNWTFVDRTGTPIGSNYVDVKSFAEGLAPVRVKDGWGYADRMGRLVIPAIFADADHFSDGLAATRIGGDVFNYADLHNFGGSWGYIDRSGNEVIEHKYSMALEFSQGLAFVCKEVAEKNVCGAIDRTGVERIKFEFSRTAYFREGLASICEEVNGENRCGAIDLAGNVKIPFVYLSLAAFKDGIALARNLSKRFLFVDREGHSFGESGSALGFDDARIFRSGLAAVKQGGLWGFIDRTGEMVVTPKYVDVAPDWKYTEGHCPSGSRILTGWDFRD